MAHKSRVITHKNRVIIPAIIVFQRFHNHCILTIGKNMIDSGTDLFRDAVDCTNWRSRHRSMLLYISSGEAVETNRMQKMGSFLV